MKRTITYGEVELDVEFDYQPEEKTVWYYADGSGYPGCAASIDNISVSHKGENITEIFTATQINKIEINIWDLLANEEPDADDRND